MLVHCSEAYYQCFSFFAVLLWFETFEDKDNVERGIANPAQIVLCYQSIPRMPNLYVLILALHRLALSSWRSLLTAWGLESHWPAKGNGETRRPRPVETFFWWSLTFLHPYGHSVGRDPKTKQIRGRSSREASPEGRAEGSSKDKISPCEASPPLPLLGWIPTQATRQLYRNGRACWLEVPLNRRFKNTNVQGVMMKSKPFKKRAIIIVSVGKEHTHTQPRSVPLSRTAAAGTVTTGSSDFGRLPTPSIVSPKGSQPSQPRIALILTLSL